MARERNASCGDLFCGIPFSVPSDHLYCRPPGFSRTVLIKTSLESPSADMPGFAARQSLVEGLLVSVAKAVVTIAIRKLFILPPLCTRDTGAR